VPQPLPWSWEGYCTDVYVEYYSPRKLKKLVLLNAMVLPRKPMVVVSMPTTIDNVKAIVSVAEKIESYIGHSATAQLLSQLLSLEVLVNRGEYNPEAGDVAIVVRLKRRLERPEDVKNVTIDDVEFYVVNYFNDKVREESPTFIIYTFPATF
jgi:hypothetical protein